MPLLRLVLAVAAMLLCILPLAAAPEWEERFSKIEITGFRKVDGIPVANSNILEIFAPLADAPPRAIVWQDFVEGDAAYTDITLARLYLLDLLLQGADGLLDPVRDSPFHAGWGTKGRPEGASSIGWSNAEFAAKFAVLEADYAIRFTRVGERPDAKLHIRVLKVPSGDVAMEATLAATPETIAAEFPAVVRKMLVAMGCKLPEGQEETFADGCLGTPEACAAYVKRVLEGGAAEGRNMDTPEVAAALREWYEADKRNALAHMYSYLTGYSSGALTAEQALAVLAEPGAPTSPIGAGYLAKRFNQRGEHGHAEKALRFGLTLPGPRAQCLAQLSYLLLDQGRHEQAIEAMVAAVDARTCAREKMQILGDFALTARTALQSGMYPSDLSARSQELIPLMIRVALAANSEAFARCPDLVYHAYQLYPSQVLAGVATPREASPIVDLVLERTNDRYHRSQVLSILGNLAMPQWFDDFPLAAEYILPNLDAFDPLPLMTRLCFDWVYFLCGMHPDDRGFAVAAIDALAGSETKRRFFATVAAKAIANDPKDAETRFYGLAAMAEAAQYPGPDEALLCSSLDGLYPIVGTVGMGLLHLVHGEVIERGGDHAGAAKAFDAAKAAGLVEPALQERLDLALAMAKARAGDRAAVLALVPDAKAASPHGLLRRVQALLLGDDAEKAQALEEATAAFAAKPENPLVQDAYGLALMANGQAQRLADDIATRFAGKPALPSPLDHHWRVARAAVGASPEWP